MPNLENLIDMIAEKLVFKKREKHATRQWI